MNLTHRKQHVVPAGRRGVGTTKGRSRAGARPLIAPAVLSQPHRGHPGDVLALQRTVGNAAVARLVDAGRPMPVVHRQAKPPASEEAELRARAIRTLGRSISLIESYTRIIRDSQRRYVKEIRGWFVGPVAETLGGAKLPNELIYVLPLQRAALARALLRAGDVRGAATQLRLAEQQYNKAAKTWRTFIGRAISGGGRAVTTLEITRDVSFTVVTTYLTGGATTGAAKLVGSTAGKWALGSLAASGVATTGKLVEEAATRTSEMATGLRKEFGVVAMLKSAGDTALIGFVTGAAGDLLGKYLGSFYPAVVKRFDVRYMRSIGVDPETLLTFGDKLLVNFVKGTGKEAFKEVLKATLAKMNPDAKTDKRPFWRRVMREFAVSEGGNRFLEYAKRFLPVKRS